MPLYEYYCTKCATKYELLRSMSRSDDPATCPNGHKGGARTLSMFASVSDARSRWTNGISLRSSAPK